MNNEFEKWAVEFREQHLNAFNNNPTGLLWLKIRAICRSKQLKTFLQENKIELKSRKIAEQNIELFTILEHRKDAMSILDSFLKCIYNEWYTEMGVNIEQLKNDLYKVQYYSWGGDQKNSLDKYFISHYVKIIYNFNELLNKQAEIGANAWNYVQNSWYNNWTSFLIESIFKQNPRIISAVGEIKSVDFFIDNYPMDLKVTFFPNQFMDIKFKALYGKNPLSWLKAKCKEIGITCDNKNPSSQQMYTLCEKLKEQGRDDIVNELNSIRSNIIKDSQQSPYELIKWLYENQGEMRFGAENRLYIVLADLQDYSQSWKMKRALSLIEPKIQAYINAFSSDTLKKINFEYKTRNYTTLSDILFIIK